MFVIKYQIYGTPTASTAKTLMILLSLRLPLFMYCLYDQVLDITVITNGYLPHQSPGDAVVLV